MTVRPVEVKKVRPEVGNRQCFAGISEVRRLSTIPDPALLQSTEASPQAGMVEGRIGDARR